MKNAQNLRQIFFHDDGEKIYNIFSKFSKQRGKTNKTQESTQSQTQILVRPHFNFNCCQHRIVLVRHFLLLHSSSFVRSLLTFFFTMSDNCGCGPSGPPTCSTGTGKLEIPPAPKLDTKCEVPPTLTFKCPGDDCKKVEDPCAPKKDDCAPAVAPADNCGSGGSSRGNDNSCAQASTPPFPTCGKKDDGFCASVSRGSCNNNDCEPLPLFMDPKDAKCGPKC